MRTDKTVHFRGAEETGLTWAVEGRSLRVENEHYQLELDLSRGAAVTAWRVGPAWVSCISAPGAQIFGLAIGSDRDPRPRGTGNIGPRLPRGWITQDVHTIASADSLRVEVRLVSDLEHLHCSLWIELDFDPGDTFRCALRSEGMGRTLSGYLEFPLLKSIAIGGDADKTRSVMLGRLPIRRDEVDLPVAVLDGSVGMFSTFSELSILPTCFMGEGDGVGISIKIEPSAFSLVPPTAASLAHSRYPVRMGSWSTRIVGIEVGPCAATWGDVFRAYRDSIRARLNTAHYEREDQRWYGTGFTSLFANVHSQEVYDHARGEYVLDEYIEASRRRFGGVDSVVLWTSYPNLGIDERSQFDLIDDLPGGRARIRQLFDDARSKGVRPFIAYLPWHTADPDVDHADAVARLVGDLGADGVFLDSMWTAHPRFREALDQIDLSHVVFMSEFRPPLTASMESLSLITGSWAQNLPMTMPCVDLLRFIVPEHKVFVVDRGARQRRSMVETAFFSGNGIVLWDRNFGTPGFMHEAANTYTAEDEMLIRRCYAIWSEHRAAFMSMTCDPLVESLAAGLFVNRFLTDGQMLYTLYNSQGQRYSGPVLRLAHHEVETHLGRPQDSIQASDAWNGTRLDIEWEQGHAIVHGAVEGKDVGCIVLTGAAR